MSLGPTKNVSTNNTASLQQARAVDTTASAASNPVAAAIEAHSEAVRVPADAAAQAATRAVKAGDEESVRARRLTPNLAAPAGAEAPRRGLGIENQEFAGKRSASGRRTAENTTTTTPKDQQMASLTEHPDTAKVAAPNEELILEVNRRSGSGTKMSPPRSRGAYAPEQIKDPSLLA